MGFNIGDYNESFDSKVLTPGVHFCRIRGIELSSPPYDPKAIQITLLLEGEDKGLGFEGALIDKNDPSKGRYTGQIGYVKLSRYAFRDWTTPDGKFIDADTSACRAIAKLASQLKILEELKNDPRLQKEVNVEELVQIARPYFLDPDLWAYYAIGGTEKWVEGYSNPNYNLYLVKPEKGFTNVSVNKEKVQPYNEELFIIKTERDTTPVTEDDEFNPDDLTPVENKFTFPNDLDNLGI